MRNYLNKRASVKQKKRLKYEAFCCAIILANLQYATCRHEGTIYYGDQIRPFLSKWFSEGKLPGNIKTYFVVTWIIPTADELLFRGGFKTHNSGMMFNNMTVEEADYLIRKFKEIKESLQKPPEKIIETENKLTNLRMSRRYGNKTATA